MREVGSCEDTYKRFYEVEVLEIILNDALNSSQLAQGDVVMVQSGFRCGQYLYPDTEYLLYLRTASLRHPVGASAEAPYAAPSQGQCSERALLETWLCNGNEHSPDEKMLQKARKICTRPVPEPTRIDSGSAILSDVPSIISASCIVIMAVLRVVSI